MRSSLKWTLLALSVLCLAGCDDPKEARRVLDAAGYSGIHTHGHAFFVCQHDSFATSFTALNPAGRPVSGAVCSNWFFGGSHIQF